MSIYLKSLQILACGAILLAAGDAEADKLADILARGKLIVGTGSTNPPWHFRDEAGNLAGFDVDVAKIVAKGLFDDPEKVEFVNQASDARIPNVVTDKVVHLWRTRWEKDVQTYQFPAELGLGHDIIDVKDLDMNVAAVYPKLIELIDR